MQVPDDESHISEAPDYEVLTPDAIHQARLPVREGGLGLPSAAEVSGPASIGCQALVLTRAMAANNRLGLDSTLRDLTSTPHAMELCKELRKLTTFASDQEIVEMVGSSWAALALDKNPANRGQGTLFVGAGASGPSAPAPAPQRTGISQSPNIPPQPGPPTEGGNVPGLRVKPHSKTTRASQAHSRITRAVLAAQDRKSDLRAPSR